MKKIVTEILQTYIFFQTLAQPLLRDGGSSFGPADCGRWFDSPHVRQKELARALPREQEEIGRAQGQKG